MKISRPVPPRSPPGAAVDHDAGPRPFITSARSEATRRWRILEKEGWFPEEAVGLNSLLWKRNESAEDGGLSAWNEKPALWFFFPLISQSAGYYRTWLDETGRSTGLSCFLDTPETTLMVQNVQIWSVQLKIKKHKLVSEDLQSFSFFKE